MPITVVKDLPAIAKLAEENIFVMDTVRAETQDIRPLQILIVNLMPTKEITENTDFKSIKAIRRYNWTSPYFIWRATRRRIHRNITSVRSIGPSMKSKISSLTG